MLYIVATPIWNLEDITYRAVRILSEVDFIACEDTRTSGILLKHYNIKKTLLSYHSHSWENKIDKIISLLKEWKKVALISDAGTPSISDPGYALVREAIKEKIPVSPIPWPSAVISALSASGMQSNHFLYLGFLPIKKWRKTILEKLKSKENTAVIYESVHRIEKTLIDLQNTFWSDHEIVIGREITKKFEEFIRWNIEEIINHFKQNKAKWEFVIIF